MRNKPIRIQFLLVFLSFLVLLIGFIFIVNAFFLKPFYVWTKTEQLKSVSRNFDQVTIDSQNQDFRKLTEEAVYEDQANVDLFNAEGRIRYSTRNPHELHPIDFRSLFSNAEWERLQQGEMIVQEKTDFRRNQEFLTVYRALPNGQYLSLSSAVAAIEQSVSTLNQFLLLVLVLFLILAWIWATRFANFFSRPIVTLQQMTQRMTQFDFSQQWLEPRRDELGDLGSNMNKLMLILDRFIEELKGKNELLESELERKNSMERMRKQFVSNVSHELKTPIALIQGYAEGLKLNVNEDSAGREEYCEVIIDEAKKMNVLVRELLLLSQLELGQSALKQEAFSIEKAIHTAVTRLQGLYADRGIQFELALEEHADDVYGDTNKINQVLNNYLSNAVFFLNERKLIRIETRTVELRRRISVFNTGPHIPEEEMELIWTSFYKVDKARTRGEGGTGLGLSIVQRIMDLHHMNYGVTNVEGGVTFWFELPLASDLDLPEDRE